MDDAGYEALTQIDPYQRSGVIRDLLLNRNPDAVASLHLKAKLCILEDNTRWTRVLVSISKELKELEELTETPNSVRAERARALALKACLLKEDVDCEAVDHTLKQAMRLYSAFSGKKVKVKEIENELRQELKRDSIPAEVPS